MSSKLALLEAKRNNRLKRDSFFVALKDIEARSAERFKAIQKYSNAYDDDIDESSSSADDDEDEDCEEIRDLEEESVRQSRDGDLTDEYDQREDELDRRQLAKKVQDESNGLSAGQKKGETLMQWNDGEIISDKMVDLGKEEDTAAKNETLHGTSKDYSSTAASPNLHPVQGGEMVADSRESNKKSDAKRTQVRTNRKSSSSPKTPSVSRRPSRPRSRHGSTPKKSRSINASRKGSSKSTQSVTKSRTPNSPLQIEAASRRVKARNAYNKRIHKRPKTPSRRRKERTSHHRSKETKSRKGSTPSGLSPEGGSREGIAIVTGADRHAGANMAFMLASRGMTVIAVGDTLQGLRLALTGEAHYASPPPAFNYSAELFEDSVQEGTDTPKDDEQMSREEKEKEEKLKVTSGIHSCNADIGTPEGRLAVQQILDIVMMTTKQPLRILVHALTSQLPDARNPMSTTEADQNESPKLGSSRPSRSSTRGSFQDVRISGGPDCVRNITLRSVSVSAMIELSTTMAMTPLHLTQVLLPCFGKEDVHLNRVLMFVNEMEPRKKTAVRQGAYAVGRATLRSITQIFRQELPNHSPRAHVGSICPIRLTQADSAQILGGDGSRKDSSIKPKKVPRRLRPLDPIVFAAFVAWVCLDTTLENFQRNWDLHERFHQKYWAMKYKKAKLI